MLKRLVISVGLLLGGVALAQQPATVPVASIPAMSAAAASRLAVAKPYLTQETIYVLRVDVRRVDVDAIETWASAKLIPSMVAEAGRADAVAKLHKIALIARGLRSQLIDAGVTDVLMIAGQDTMRHVAGIVVIPVSNKADTTKLVEGLRGLIGQSGFMAVNATPEAIMIGASRDGELAVEFVPADRPDLAAALAAGTDAPVQMAMSLPQSMRDELAAQQPNLPRQLGGGSSATISQGWKWSLFELNLPPKMALASTTQMGDAAQAKEMVSIVTAALNTMQQQFSRMGMDLSPLMQAMNVQANKDQVVLAMDETAVQQVTTWAAGLMTANRGRGAHGRPVVGQKGESLKQVAGAVAAYAKEHQNAFPEKLGDAAPNAADPVAFAKLIASPTGADQTPAFVYVKPRAEILQARTAKNTLVLYEGYGQWPAPGILLGYADGHVQRIHDEAAFKRLLEIHQPVAK